MKLKSIAKNIACSSLLLLSVSAFADATPQFKQIVFLGDSLSDDGNLFRHTNELIPKFYPYYKGRFTNGYNWADALSYQLFKQDGITSQNYAVGGATAALHNPFEGYLPVTLDLEYDDYVAWNLLKDKSNTLYVIWIGANDYLPGRKNVDQATTDTVNAITSVVSKLAANSGAQFLIIDLPDLSSVPHARAANLVDNYKALSVMHNQKLHAAILQLQTEFPAVKIMEFSFTDHPILYNLVNSPDYRAKFNAKYHLNITDVADACWGGGFTQPTAHTIESTLVNNKNQKNNSTINFHGIASQIENTPALMTTYQVDQKAASGLSPCAQPDQYVFWDDVHPTRVMHQVFAKIMLKEILENQ